MRRLALSVGFLVGLARVVGAAPDPRTAGNSLLETADARVTGLAGAGTALTGDIGAATLNPAGLAPLAGTEVSTQFQTAPGDVHTGLVAYGRGNGRAAWAVTAVYFDAGKIDIVPTIGTPYTRRAQQDFVGALTGGMTWGENLRLGASAKALSSDLAGHSASAFAGDVGIQWDPTRLLGFGVAATNLGSKLTYRNQGDPLPTEYRAGVAVRLVSGASEEYADVDAPWYARLRMDTNYINLLGDAVLDGFGGLTGALGVEWDYAHRATLRAGGRFGRTGETFSAGMGFWIKSWRLDYSFQAVGDLTDRHRVTVSWFLKKKAEQ